ncbi:MAG: TolC family protein [Pseudomonadota bacterium]|nr:TolC family protein [Pseudomonadota bacterium]
MFSRIPVLLLGVSLTLITNPVLSQEWTLASSVKQALSVSPELEKSQSQIGARQEDVKLSGMWPDPSVELRVDNKLGKDDGSGGYDLTDITLSQPIPLSRLKYQKSVAESRLQAAQATKRYQSLQLQNRVAKVFHQLQFASAKLKLSKKRLTLANRLNRKPRKNDAGTVVRYLTPLEKIRLNIILKEAQQAVINAEGKYHEALSEFTRLLVIEPQSTEAVAALQPVKTLPDTGRLLAIQKNHPRLASQQQTVMAATHNIGVARSSQLADPTLSISRSKDVFAAGREDVYGVMLSVQIPLHSRKDTAVSKAGYQAHQQRIELQRLQRDLQINLKRSLAHLSHLVEQSNDYQQTVLKPARQMLDLTQKGFASGELNMLSLVDANNTYFDSRLRYLELLYQSRAELADVKLYAGQAVSPLAATPIEQGGQ